MDRPMTTGDAAEAFASEVYLGFVAVGEAQLSPSARAIPAPDVQETLNGIFLPGGALLGSVTQLSRERDRLRWSLPPDRDVTGETRVHAVDLPFNYWGIFGYCKIHANLSTADLIQMASLVRGLPKQLGSTVTGELSYLFDGSEISLKQMLRHWLPDSDGARLVVPVIYVSDCARDVQTADDLLRDYRGDIAAIATLAPMRSDLAKESYVERLLQADAHPFIYGITIFSPVCTLEIHPKITRTIIERQIAADVNNVTADAHHVRELNVLCGLLLVALLQRAALEADNQALDNLLRDRWRASGLGIIRDLLLMRRISTRRRTIAMRLGLYLNVGLTHHEYLREILEKLRGAFQLGTMYENVTAKLDHLKDDINLLYTAQSTAVLIALSALAAIFGLGSLVATVWLAPP